MNLGGYMNVLFLDFDGVINTYYWEEHDGVWECHINNECDGKVNNRQAMCWLNELCKQQHLSIVVTSTWRKSFTEEEIELVLRESGLDEEIPVMGVTTVIGEQYARGKEIRLFLKEHPEIEKMVILDDDSYDMYEFLPYVAKCNTYHGFGIPELHCAENILKNQVSYEWKDLEPIDEVEYVIRK